MAKAIGIGVKDDYCALLQYRYRGIQRISNLGNYLNRNEHPYLESVCSENNGTALQSKAVG
jgi:hypothetical protein